MIYYPLTTRARRRSSGSDGSSTAVQKPGDTTMVNKNRLAAMAVGTLLFAGALAVG
jgi:hypothetical protein